MTLEEMILPREDVKGVFYSHMQDIRGRSQLLGGIIVREVSYNGRVVEVASQSEETSSFWAKLVRQGKKDSWQIIWAVERAERGRGHRWLACLVTSKNWEERFYDLTSFQGREDLNALRGRLEEKEGERYTWRYGD